MTKKPQSQPKLSYLICSTPRTGSTYLCSLLKSTGIAGYPESYFRKQDLLRWATEWGIVNDNNEYAFPDFLEATIENGITPNGTFAARVMWGTLEEIIIELYKTNPLEKKFDKDILQDAFGHTKYIFLQRVDRVAQAVSLSKALQSDIWHIQNGENISGSAPNLQYDFDQIHQFVLEADEHNQAWEAWFAENNIAPFRLTYEELSANPKEMIKSILNFLSVEYPEGIEINSRNKRMADDLSTRWIERYKLERP